MLLYIEKTLKVKQMDNHYAKKIYSATLIILISNIIAGLAFILAGIFLKENLLIIGGIFVFIAGIVFRLLISNMLSRYNNNQTDNN